MRKTGNWASYAEYVARSKVIPTNVGKRKAAYTFSLYIIQLRKSRHHFMEGKYNLTVTFCFCWKGFGFWTQSISTSIAYSARIWSLNPASVDGWNLASQLSLPLSNILYLYFLGAPEKCRSPRVFSKTLLRIGHWCIEVECRFLHAAVQLQCRSSSRPFLLVTCKKVCFLALWDVLENCYLVKR